MLGKSQYIPQGHWFAYLDEDALKDVDQNTLNCAKNILKNGLLSNRGQGVKRLTTVERGQSPYEYKIRLLGAQGKGDIRLYGRVETTKINNKTYNLIIFDHINYHAHKKHELPRYGHMTRMV